MADRVVKVSLIASVGNYVAGMQQAAQATSKATTEAEKAAEKQKSMQKSMETVAKTGLVVGGAITAVGIAALKTGIQYNTLQQTSRAALTTLLGSAKAANEQMDKLDAFARTSPFSKATFITAQQQLIGFGMEAKKVLPTLDAIQNAVAATGGSNQMLSEITFVLAQIQAAGKITGQDLMQLGQRGIDAATLIGSQMGKTGAQIRKDITAGALDAGTALDALTKGMQERFGGAAANVKNTFAGATDRMKAAWRDFSAALADPLVGKNGGGGLVDLLNFTADLMRGFLKLPDPIKIATSTAIGLVGAVSLIGGASILALPKLVAFRAALATITAESPRAAAAVGGVTGALRAIPTVAAVATFAVVGSELADMTLQATGAKKTVDGLNSSIDKLGSKKAIDEALGLGGDGALKGATSFGWMSDFSNTVDGLMSSVRQLDPTSKLLDTSMRPMRANLAALDQTMAQMVQRGDTKKAANAFEYLASKTDGSKEAIAKLKDEFLPLYTTALRDAKGAATGVADAQQKATDTGYQYSAAAAAAGKSLSDASDDTDKWLQAVGGADAAFIDLKGAYDSVIQMSKDAKPAFIDLKGAYDGVTKANKDAAQATADGTKSTKDSWEDYYNGVSVNVDKYLKQLDGQVKAQSTWESNMSKLAGRVSSGTLSELQKLGTDGAPLIAALVNASDQELGRLNDVMAKRGNEAAGTFTREFYLKQLDDQVKAQADWETNMVKLSGKVSAGTLSELAKLGPQGAPLVAQLVTASGDELGKLDGLMKQKADQATGTFAATLSAAGPVIQAAAAQLGQDTADRIATELANGTTTIEQVIALYGLKVKDHPIPIGVDTTGALAQVDRFVKAVNGSRIRMTLDAATDSIKIGRAFGGILPGAPSRKDNMIIHAASGEFITNSTATSVPSNRAALEYMNRGGVIRGYANGGYVDGYARPQYVQSTMRPATAAQAGMTATVNQTFVVPEGPSAEQIARIAAENTGFILKGLG